MAENMKVRQKISGAKFVRILRERPDKIEISRSILAQSKNISLVIKALEAAATYGTPDIIITGRGKQSVLIEANAKKPECTLANFPAVVTKEGKWFIARCPAMDLVTQGKTENEAIENLTDLIDEYLSDPDIPKPAFSISPSPVTVVSLPVHISKGIPHAKTPAPAST